MNGSIKVSYHKEREVVDEVGGTILDISLKHGIAHMHRCGGQARCSTCRVVLLAGSANVEKRNELEQQMARDKGWPDAVRLACQARPLGDIRVRLLVQDDDDLALILSEPPTVADGAEKSLAILFCDVRDFTGFSEANLPYDVVHVLNRYFREICDPVLANSGQIGNYMGDGLLAYFGMSSRNPAEDCENALRSAIRMNARVEKMNGYLEQNFGRRFRIGIGLHWGKAIVGNVGHPSRYQLTAIGDAVNMASRIESMTKRTGSRILASEQFVDQIRSRVQITRRFTAQIKGKKGQHALFQLDDFAKPDANLIVQSTFDLLAPSGERVAALFYENLFQLRPDLRALFKNTDMHLQGQMLMSMLATAIRGLDTIDDLAPAIRALGGRHRGYGVTPRDYADVGKALLQTLEAGLADLFTRDVAIAWTETYARLTRLMEPSQADEKIKSEARPRIASRAW